LAAAFPFASERPFVAVAILGAAGVSDVLDGWYARRHGQVTPTGAAIDPITDKVFVLTVAVALVRSGRLSPIDVLLLSTREAAELPLVLWIVASTRARARRADHPSANLPGKLATVSQFATATAALFRVAELRWMIVATAVVGAIAAATYWLRAAGVLAGRRKQSRKSRTVTP
jgi:phosphatidylglycerophosphate synthase